MDTNHHNLLTDRRETYIDLFRSIGILLMIGGHLGIGGIYDRYIHTFHMPMFFILAGLFFKKRTIKESVKRDAQKLLFPYSLVGLTHYIVYCVIYKLGLIEGNGYLAPLKSFLFINTSDDMPICGAIWFLTCLFIAKTLFMIARKAIPCKGEDILFTVLLSTIGIYWTRISGVRLPLAADTAMVGMGFVCIGFHLRNYWNHLMNLKWWLFIFPFVICSILAIKTPYVNMRTGQYGYPLIFLIDAVVLSVSLCRFCREINEIRALKNLLQIFQTIGKRSMTFLCFNQLFILLFMLLFGEVMSLRLRALGFIVTVALIYILDVGIQNISLRSIL